MALEVRVQPLLTVSETYTDNVDLTPPGSEQHDFITQINPGVSARVRSGKSEASLEYTLQTLTYARESDRNNINHLLAASGKTELVDNFLFMDGSASITQQNISLLGPLGVNIGNDTANRTEARTYAISPFVRDRFSNVASYEVRYKHDHVSGAASLAASDSDSVNASVRSGPAFNRFGWGINYSREVINYQSLQDTTAESISADLRYALNPRFALLGTIGYERNDFAFVGEKPEGKIWNVGFSWQPSNLTALTATGGERFFGKTYALNYSHQSRLFAWKASYSENISSTRQQLLIPQAIDTFSYLDQLASGTIKDPVERARFVNDFITARGLSPTLFSAVNFYTSQTFLEKRGDASITYNAGKTVIVANAFRVNRDTGSLGGIGGSFFGSGDFATSTNVRQQGIGLVFNWRFAPKTDIDVNLGSSDTLFRDSGFEDTLRYLRIGLRHQLQPKISGSVDVRHVARDSNEPLRDYRENALVGTVNIRF